MDPDRPLVADCEWRASLFVRADGADFAFECFDAREHAAAVVKRVIDPITERLVSYRTGYTLDSLDRLSSVQYPDNDVVHYEYNERGLGRRIRGGRPFATLQAAIEVARTEHESRSGGSG